MAYEIFCILKHLVYMYLYIDLQTRTFSIFLSKMNPIFIFLSNREYRHELAHPQGGSKSDVVAVALSRHAAHHRPRQRRHRPVGHQVRWSGC